MPRSVRTRVSRRIAADPTSTALLLAAPTAVELWPGARRVGESDGQVLVEAVPPPAGDGAAGGVRPTQADAPGGAAEPVDADGAAGPRQVTLRALPSRRTPTAYVTRFQWCGQACPAVSGRLTLAYAPTGDGTPVTYAELELDSDREVGHPGRALTQMAEGFLANLARAAEARNRAA